jgi:hypothetical protein
MTPQKQTGNPLCCVQTSAIYLAEEVWQGWLVEPYLVKSSQRKQTHFVSHSSRGRRATKDSLAAGHPKVTASASRFIGWPRFYQVKTRRGIESVNVCAVP